MNKQKIVLIAVIAVVAIAGFWFLSMGRQKIAERTAESIIERASGGKVDVNIKKGGQEYEYKTDEGTMNISNKKELPSEFPRDVSVYPGAEVDTSMVQSGENAGIFVSFKTKAGVEEVIDWYGERLKDQGWDIKTTTKSDDAAYLMAEKGAKALSLTVATDSDESGTTIVVSYGDNANPQE